MVDVTMAISFFSDRSIVWKMSLSGTPYFLQASWNLFKAESVSIASVSSFLYFSISKLLVEVLANLEMTSTARIDLVDRAGRNDVHQFA